MATIRKRDGRWRAQVRRKGHPHQFKSFQHKAEAKAWARQLESEMERGMFVSRIGADTTTVGELLDRYLREITPAKASERSEKYRIACLKAEFGPRFIGQLRPDEIATFRNARLSKGLTGGTVIKDLNTLSHVIDTARKEWDIHLPDNPVRMVKRPKVASGRQRRLLDGEEALLLAACKASRAPALPVIFGLALATAMRRGELLSLEWKHIDLDAAVAYLPHTKNGESRRVPLSTKAVTLLQGWPRSTCGKMFPQWSRPDSFENAWRRVVAKVGLADFRFHDLRHEATSRLFERGLNVMQVAAITGHKTLQMLKRYTHLKAEDLVKLIG